MANGAKEKPEPSFWDINLSVPAKKMDAIFSTFTDEEKANAISGILQDRLDQAIGAYETAGDGKDEGQSAQKPAA